MVKYGGNYKSYDIHGLIELSWIDEFFWRFEFKFDSFFFVDFSQANQAVDESNFGVQLAANFAHFWHKQGKVKSKIYKDIFKK